jgi:hypothetical protein
MQINKKNLLSLIENNIKEMAMDFDGPDRPDQGLQNKLATGDTPLKKVPFPSTGNPNKNFQEILASERYRQVVSNLRRYVGGDTPVQSGMSGLMQLQGLLMNTHNRIVQLENNNRQELEQLAIELVMKEMGIPEDAIEFDAKIIGMGEIDTSDFNREEQGQEENTQEVDIENEIEIFNELQNFDLERAKRRMINAIIQGASKKGHYMFHLAPERLQQITGEPNILNLYGILMSILDVTYWQATDQLLKGSPNSIAGKESVERPDEDDPEGKPKVIARGINFPILVHELIKGVLELFAIQGRPEDETNFEDIESSEDTLEKEMWDLRLGPAIWDRVRSQFPEDILTDENKVELQNYLLTEIFKLPAKKFLVFMKEILSGSDRGKRMMNELMDGINKMFNDQDYEESISMFRDDLEDATDETESGDINDFLKSLGIEGKINDEDEDEDEDDGELKPRR